MPKSTKLIQLKKNNFLINTYFFLLSLLFYMVCNEAVAAIDPKLDPQYGNGQSTKFINAMYGTGPNVTTEELQKIQNSIPPDNTHRFFIRFGINNGTSTLSKVKNTTVQPIIETAIVTSTTQTAKSKYGGEMAFGYRADNFSMELGLMATENMKYNKAPLFSNQLGALNSTVKAQSVLLNIYYDFIHFMAFRTFFGVGVGAGINRTNSNFFNRPPMSTGENFARRRVAGAYNLVLGCKLNIVPQLFVVTSMRYTNFAGFGNIKTIATSNVEWRDVNQNLHLEGQHTLFGFSINLVHIFL